MTRGPLVHVVQPNAAERRCGQWLAVQEAADVHPTAARALVRGIGCEFGVLRRGGEGLLQLRAEARVHKGPRREGGCGLVAFGDGFAHAAADCEEGGLQLEGALVVELVARGVVGGGGGGVAEAAALAGAGVFRVHGYGCSGWIETDTGEVGPWN